MSFSVHFLSWKQQKARTTANIGLMDASESFLFIFIHRVEMTMHFERTPKERHIFRHHLKKDCFLVFLIHKNYHSIHHFWWQEKTFNCHLLVSVDCACHLPWDWVFFYSECWKASLCSCGNLLTLSLPKTPEFLSE